jgi:SAM-dependent methyltransferase
MKHQKLLRQVEQYYTGKVREHGATHRGVDWNSQESQELRFTQLLKVMGDDRSASVLDYGCGYGAMARYMRTVDYTGSFSGFDISDRMIDQAKLLQTDLSDCVFYSDPAHLAPADYTIASGIFNVKFYYDPDEWQQYVLDTLAKVRSLSKKGFSYNMLTGYSDADRMRPDLYYGDPSFFIDHCIRTYSRHVVMLHNYGLYEFTILVELK